MMKRLVVLITIVALGLAASAHQRAEASLASIGYTMLGWLDRADILHHDLTARIDPPRWSAKFSDDITFKSARSRQLHILLGKDARLDRVTIPDSDEPVKFYRTIAIGALPFHIYKIDLPRAPGDETFTLRFEWTIDSSTVQFINPFVDHNYFYIGYASIWYPHMPEESFFTADVTILSPQGYLAFAEGTSVLESPADQYAGAARFASEDLEGWALHQYRTSVPVNGMGLGVGRFGNESMVVFDDYKVEVWRPRGVGSTAQQVGLATARAVRFLAERLGAPPINEFRVVEVPFPWATSYAGLSNLVYGGDLSEARIEGRDGLALFAAHEAAHKWIGSTVGIRLIGGAWLSEGLAEYLGYLALADAQGSEVARDLFERRAYEPFTAGTPRRAIGAIEMFDDDAPWMYTKSPLVFRMLHRRLGTERFFAAVRAFLDEHGGTHIAGRDFEATVVRHASASSLDQSGSSEASVKAPQRGWSDPVALQGVGGNLSTFFNTWIRSNRSLDYELNVDVAVAVPEGGVALSVSVRSIGAVTEPGDVDIAFAFPSGDSIRDALPLGEVRVYHFDGLPNEVRLDPDLWLADSNPSNNTWRPTKTDQPH